MIKYLGIDGVFLVKNKIRKDSRGENRQVLMSGDLFMDSPVEISQSHSKSGVLRGYHIQKWNKFVYPIRGQLLIYLMDVRKISDTYCKQIRIEIGDKNRGAIYIPKGVAHLYVALTDVDYLYFHTEVYSDKKTYTFSWKETGLKGKYIMSKKDRQALPFKKVERKLGWL